MKVAALVSEMSELDTVTTCLQLENLMLAHVCILFDTVIDDPNLSNHLYANP